MAEEIASTYAAQLVDLKMNSKPVINVLTMMAEDFLRDAPVIVQTIEKHLSRVKPDVKLPVLYLIDSIIKNVKKDYVHLFTQNIVSTFCGVFERVDDKTKTQMFKLRQTWNDVFIPKKLYAIDVRCRQVDPNWPVTVPSAASIHVNPKFLNRPLTVPPITGGSLPTASVVSSSLSDIPSLMLEPAGDLTEAQMREQLLMKQKELLELQQKKLELELMQTKARLEEQTRLHLEEQNRKQLDASIKQQQLLQQAEMAKHQTDMAAHIMALAGAGTSSFPVAPVPSYPVSKPVVLPPSETYADDPRIRRHMPDKSRGGAPTLPIPSASAKLESQKPSQVMTSKSKQSTEGYSQFASASRIHDTSSDLYKKSPVAMHFEQPPSSDLYLLSPTHDRELEKEKDVSHAQQRKRHYEVSEFNLFEKNSVKDKEHHKKDRDKDKKGRDGRVNRDRDKISSRRSRERSRSPEVRKSKEKDKRKNIEVKLESNESDEDYEDEMKGYSALTIKPRRQDIPNSPSDRKSSASSLSPLLSLSPVHSGNSSKGDTRSSPSGRDKSHSNSSPKGKTVSPVSVSSGSKKFEPPLVENNWSKSSPNLNINSSTSSISATNSFSNPVSVINVDISATSSPSKKNKKVSIDKDKDRKDRDKDRDKNKDKHSKKDKSRYKDKDAKDRDSNKDRKKKTTHWKDYNERKSAVLLRNYRKKTDQDMEEDENVETKTNNSASSMGSNSNLTGTGDIDLRFDSLKDVDLRKETEGSSQNVGGEPPSKKARTSATSNNSSGNGATGNSTSLIDDLFGREDVDLRQSASSGSWSQVKKPTADGESGRHGQQIQPPNNSGRHNLEHDEDIREILQRQNRNRPPPPISPANSICSNRSSCDPLGRPLLYHRLPDDPEERKRSLDSRSASIDPVEQFRMQYIDRALHGSGELTQSDVKNACLRAKEELDQGFLNTDQYITVMKQLAQINEANKIREVQQMQQMGGPNWQGPSLPNPWTGETEDVWSRPRFGPRGPNEFGGMNRFSVPVNQNSWPQPGGMNGPSQWGGGIPQGPRGPNPFEEAMPAMIIDDLIPVVNELELRSAERDTASSIPLDKVMRQVRFYGDTAVVLMGMMADEPREIAFQKDNRPKTVLINGKPMECLIGDTKFFDLNRKQHTLKLSAPTRELYLDDAHYEACFGGPPIRIPVDGRLHTFQLKGPPPQVEVGKKPRFDLLAGRVNLILDAVNSIPIYLDEKPQILDLFGIPVILRFCDGFHTVTLNGRPFPTNFGARLPFSVSTPGNRKHFLRFSAVTATTEKAMMQFVRVRQNGPGPMEFEENISGQFRGRGGPGGRGRGRGSESIRGRPGFNVPPTPVVSGSRHGLLPDPELPPLEPPFENNPLDMLASLFPPPDMTVKAHEKKSKTKDHSYESESSFMDDGENKDEKKVDDNAGTAALNVTDLLAKLMQAGLLPTSVDSAPTPADTTDINTKPKEKAVEEVKSVIIDDKNKPKSEEVVAVTENKVEKEKKVLEKPKPVIPPLETVDIKLGEDTLKERRVKLVNQICTGVQCGSCGLRFPPDQTVRYSQHLDWHFRQNRREKANVRKAQSRKWYYDLSDWIQFEEIEDLEERAASLFESHEGDDDGDTRSPTSALNPEDSTVLASGHEGAVCPQCGEAFEAYFDEEKEEWRLRDALLDEMDGESKLYHPTCHQDYMKSLVEESIIEVDKPDDITPLDGKDGVGTVEKMEEEEDEVLILKEGKKEIVVMEIDDDDEENLKENLIDTKDSTKSNPQELLLSNNEISVNEKISETTTRERNNEIGNFTFVSNFVDNISNSVRSPIVIHDIDEDSCSFLPGISDHTDDIFMFALNSGRERGNSSPKDENKRIIYEAMKFDFPRIKLEPPDELEEPLKVSPVIITPHVAGRESSVTEITIEPENIDLTADDSMDEVDSGSGFAASNMTEIDGNLHYEGSTSMPFLPAAKIRINITGVDITASQSPNRKPENSPSQPIPSCSETPILSVDLTKKTECKTRESPSPAEGVKVILNEKGGKSPSLSTNNNNENNKDNVVGIDSNVFTEEMKRLKPRLIGRKLINCPPKNTGKEESGLCTIC